MKHLKKYEIIIGLCALFLLLFSVFQMFIEAQYDQWLLTELFGYHTAQLCLVLGLCLFDVFLFLLYVRSRKTIALVFACIFMILTFLQVLAFNNILLITHMR